MPELTSFLGDGPPPSLDAAIPEIMAAPPDAVPAILDRYAVTEEQRAFITAGAWSRVVVQRAAVKGAVAAMIAARQLYALAYAELQKALAEVRPAPHPLTEDLVVQSAMHEAAKPFDQNALIQSFPAAVLPWLADVADAANAADANAALAEMDQLDAERRATPLDVGFRVDPQQAEPHLPRDRSLLLVGWRPAVKFVIDRVVNHVLARKHAGFLATVVRLQKENVRRGEEELRLVRLGQDRWAGCCNTAGGLPRVVAEYIVPQMTHPADLVVCDDLLAAHTSSFAGRPPGAVAGDAHKRLRDWAKRDGAAVVAGVPLAQAPTEVPDLTGPEWEQAKTFATVRPVLVADLGEHYRVSVGNSAHHWDVGKAILDAATESALYLPGDFA